MCLPFLSLILFANLYTHVIVMLVVGREIRVMLSVSPRNPVKYIHTKCSEAKPLEMEK